TCSSRRNSARCAGRSSARWRSPRISASWQASRRLLNDRTPCSFRGFPMGGAIIFVCAFVACTICSMFWLVFASHYFLVTLIDSGAGQNEVEYPRESLIDWWWKPLFCLWILGFWVVVLSIMLTPLLVVSPKTYGISLGLLILFFYPLGVLSALFTANWLFFLH